jgi:glycosyltransferase involved in cell wall biosynthesis
MVRADETDRSSGPGSQSRLGDAAVSFAPVRIAIVYDCLYPHTVGGAERWYRALADRLAAAHEVTYLTRRQWPAGNDPGTSFAVVTLAPGSPLYTRSGRRRIGPPLRFGWGVFWHLLRHAGRYDVVHCASFPYFSLIGAALALRIRRRGRLLADWHEVWGRDYWIDYLGPIGGRIGHAVQRICVRLPERSFTFSRMHARRLVEEGHGRPITRLTGEYAEDAGAVAGSDAGAERPPLVMFAGRHIPEKRVTVLPDAIQRARAELPELRCVIFGDGPDHVRLSERVRELGLEKAIELRGRAPGEEVRGAMAGAACLLLPSLREGYGLVVVEALARATPAIVVDGPENAAVELIEPGVNGYVAESAAPEAIAAVVVEAVRRGPELRASTLDWYRAHADELSIESSLAEVERAYERVG